MTTKELISILSTMPPNKIVVLSDNIGWSSVKQITEEVSAVLIHADDVVPYED